MLFLAGSWINLTKQNIQQKTSIMRNKITVDVYPLFIAVGGALALGVVTAARTLFKHNEVIVDKTRPFQFQTDECPKVLPQVVHKPQEPTA